MEGLKEVRRSMPSMLLDFDTDNGNVFINRTVWDYCAAAGWNSPGVDLAVRRTK
jgi:hypothetical protein